MIGMTILLGLLIALYIMPGVLKIVILAIMMVFLVTKANATEDLLTGAIVQDSYYYKNMETAPKEKLNHKKVIRTGMTYCKRMTTKPDLFRCLKKHYDDSNDTRDFSNVTYGELRKAGLLELYVYEHKWN